MLIARCLAPKHIKTVQLSGILGISRLFAEDDANARHKLAMRQRGTMERGRERTAPPAAESMLGTEGTENQEVQQLKPRRNGSEELLRITRIAGDGPIGN